MFKHRLFLAGLLGISPLFHAQAARYADSIISYTPGTGFATDFSTGAGFTNATAALGEPSRSTSGPFGGPVDPFNPPYLKEQLVSIGAGGSLTLGFGSPILNDPKNAFGLDFLIFGNSGFAITNGNFSGGGITDGSIFSANTGSTRVSVSSDNVTYFTLDPSRSPTVDSLFPTDGSGDFSRAISSSLTNSDFSGLDIAGIRGLYAGSAGGTGFDIGWALDANGKPVNLSSIQYIRIDVISGASEIDGVAAVPEPSTWAILGLASALGGVAWATSRRQRNGAALET